MDSPEVQLRTRYTTAHHVGGELACTTILVVALVRDHRYHFPSGRV